MHLILDFPACCKRTDRKIEERLHDADNQPDIRMLVPDKPGRAFFFL
jgi:hypothetical protein